MSLPWFVQNWIRVLAAQKVRQTVTEAARRRMGEMAEAAQENASAADQPCDVGLVFAMGAESGGFEDLLEGIVTTRGQGFLVRHGTLAGRRIVLALSGVGRKAAMHATEALIAGHHPRWIISAGFCGGLSPELRRHDILVAESIVDSSGNVLTVETAPATAALDAAPRPHVGRLLTVDAIIRLPKRKREMGLKHHALAADLESGAVAEVCRRVSTRFLAVRVVSDAVDDELPAEIAGMARQNSAAGQWGAALASVLNRPGSLKDMYRLKENALISSDRLARFLARLIPRLTTVPALHDQSTASHP
jgi:adenosylhomocysteine nucleosidase